MDWQHYKEFIPWKSTVYAGLPILLAIDRSRTNAAERKKPTWFPLSHNGQFEKKEVCVAVLDKLLASKQQDKARIPLRAFFCPYFGSPDPRFSYFACNETQPGDHAGLDSSDI